jgi:plastocyanin
MITIPTTLQAAAISRRRPRRRRLAALLVAVLPFAAACGDDDATADDASASSPAEASPDTTGRAAPAPAGDETVTVTVKTFDFQPDPLTVAAGTTIRFVNEDAIDHTVTAGTREQPTPDVFDGRLPGKGSTFDLVLDEPGTYDYFCAIHAGPGMTGSIVVE